jgi:hypothetical protein
MMFATNISPFNVVEVLVALAAEITVIWDVTPCSLVELYWYFSGSFRHHDGKAGFSDSDTCFPDYIVPHFNLVDIKSCRVTVTFVDQKED